MKGTEAEEDRVWRDREKTGRGVRVWGGGRGLHAGESFIPCLRCGCPRFFFQLLTNTGCMNAIERSREYCPYSLRKLAGFSPSTLHAFLSTCTSAERHTRPGHRSITRDSLLEDLHVSQQTRVDPRLQARWLYRSLRERDVCLSEMKSNRAREGRSLDILE